MTYAKPLALSEGSTYGSASTSTKKKIPLALSEEMVLPVHQLRDFLL
jgi:hypothetical protein